MLSALAIEYLLDPIGHFETLDDEKVTSSIVISEPTYVYGLRTDIYDRCVDIATSDYH